MGTFFSTRIFVWSGIFLAVLAVAWGRVALEPTGKDIRLACEPRTVRVVPGQPILVEFSVTSDSAVPVKFNMPSDPLLLVRAVEKIPVQKTSDDLILQRRAVIWQALEPGTITISNVTAEVGGRKLKFPGVTITVEDPG